MAKSTDPFRDLLVAELAVVLEVATAKEVAVAVESYWSKRDKLDASFSDRLAQVAGIEADDLDRLEAQVDGLVREAGGDTRQALLTHGGFDRSLRRALPAESLVAREVDALAPELPRPALRPMASGRYERLNVLGKGGMGVVVLARDRELQRQVALKIMRGSNGNGSAQRFLREAQITGSLEHPGIVPIHEIGRTDDEAPYYTMRHVVGRRTLLDAIRETEHVIDRLALLEPFLRICDTVRYAHSRGVLHCDIKPTNVALGAFGETIVLDWGLARSTGEDTAATSGTPGYASPEAAGARPGDVTERSDVYGLGATLFHVLTGTVPFEFEDLAEMRRRLAVEPAPKASDRVADVPEALSRLCEKALAPDPADRFADVAEFADAVRAWRARDEIDRELASLEREAVRALADNRLDRVSGLVTRMHELDPDFEPASRFRERVEEGREGLVRQRERASRVRVLKRVAVAALVLVTTATAVMAWVLENRRAETEDARREASSERDRAEDLADFMLGDLHNKLSALGRHELLAAAARRTLEYFETVSTPDTVDARRKKAAALGSVASIFRKEGSLEDAVEAGRRATSILEELHAELPRDLGIARALANQYVDTVRPLSEAGDADAAIATARRALRLQRRVLQSNPTHPLLRAERATTLLVVSDLRQEHEDIKHAVEHCEKAVVIQRELAAEFPDEPIWRIKLAFGLGRRAALWRMQGKPDEALADHEEALALFGGLREPDSRALRQMAMSHTSVGQIHVERERFKKAHSHYEGALAVRRNLARANPMDLGLQDELAGTLIATAGVHWRAGTREAAWEPAREAVAILERLHRIDPPSRPWRQHLAVTLMELGDMYRTAEVWDDALACFDRATEIRRTLHREDPSLTTRRSLMYGVTHRGRALSRTGKLKEALACFEESATLQLQLAREDPSNRRDLHNRCWNAYWWADAYRLAHKPLRAQEHYREALLALDKALAVEPDHPRLLCNVAEIHCWLGDFLRMGRRGDRGLDHYTRAQEIAEKLCAQKNVGWRSLQALARAVALRGVVLLDLRRPKEALPVFRRAAEVNRLLSKTLKSLAKNQGWYDGRVLLAALLAGERKPESARDYALLGEFAHHSKRHAEAVAHFKRAFVDRKIMGADEYLDYAIRSAAQIEEHHELALAWLRDSVALHRARIAAADRAIAGAEQEQQRVTLKAQRDRWRRHLVFLRDEDPKLAPIRGLAGFKAAFEER